MEAYTSLILTAPHLLLIPIYIGLSPLCIVSSSLFEAALEVTFNLDQQTTMLILTLVIILSISGSYIVRLIRNRSCKSIFFYEFVFYVGCFNFILIGITYSLLRREDLLEEVLAKIFSTMLLIYFAQQIKIKTDNSIQCKICLQQTWHNDCLILRCKHSCHEKCLWQWLYVKKECPFCCEPFNN